MGEIVAFPEGRTGANAPGSAVAGRLGEPGPGGVVRGWRASAVVARTIFRQGLRGKLGFLAVAAPIAIFVLGHAFGRFEQNEGLRIRLTLETGLALSALVVLGTALLLGSRPFAQGDGAHSAAPLLAAPVARGWIYLGHLAGIGATLAVYTAGMALTMVLVMEWRFSMFRPALLAHFLTLFTEAMILAAFAALVALSGSSIISFFGTMALALVGHSEVVIAHLAKTSGSGVLDFVTWALLKLLPSFAALDVKSQAVRDLPIPWHTLGPALLHSGIYLVVLIALASAIFDSQEV